jgi:proteasome lid subunit RPN8/RPN11
MKERQVSIKRSAILSILEYAKACHPKEGILLLKGETSKEMIAVEEVEIPPLAVHGYSFSNFPLYMLPIDFSIVGTAHSHPSGVPKPSVGDLNNYYGKIMIIAAYPYNSEKKIAMFDNKGNSISYKVIEDA